VNENDREEEGGGDDKVIKMKQYHTILSSSNQMKN
jgi:hypothetical protein